MADLSRRDGSMSLNIKQWKFVNAFVETRSALEAAKRAGYSTGPRHCFYLLNNPLVKQVIEDRIEALDSQHDKTTKDILRFIHAGIFCQPLLYFEPSNNGWKIRKKDLKKLPAHVGMLIEKMTRVEDASTGDVFYNITLVSKTSLINLAAKYQLSENLEVNHNVQVDWTKMIEKVNRADNSDIVVDGNTLKNRLVESYVGGQYG